MKNELLTNVPVVPEFPENNIKISEHDKWLKSLDRIAQVTEGLKAASEEAVKHGLNPAGYPKRE